MKIGETATMTETTAMAAVPDDHPLMVAWKKHIATPGYQNSKRWARIGNAENLEGSLWALFMAGWEACQEGTQIEKPEGFDLRLKRADKVRDSSKWTPADALYEAYERVKNQRATELAVYWWAPLKDNPDRFRLHFAVSTTSVAEHAFLLQTALQKLLERNVT